MKTEFAPAAPVSSEVEPRSFRGRVKVLGWIAGFAALPALWAATPPAAPLPAPKLNVLFVMADDLNCDLGCYGAREMRTPHIDRLAARGVRFERAYCQFPLCAPSRASLLTGRRPNVTGVLKTPPRTAGISPHFREKLPTTTALPQLFRQNGWFSARIGKIYHYWVPDDIGSGGCDDPISWDLAINPRGRDREEHDKIFTLTPGKNLGPATSFLADDGEDTEQTDGIGATEAIRLLERFRREARPFFLGVGFYRPHTPYVAPKKYFDLYPLSEIKLPTLSDDDRVRVPAPAFVSAMPEMDATTDDMRRRAIQAYRASISFMDAQVGRLLDALDRLDLAQTTVVVFLSDNGYHLADHGLWQKRSLFERSTRLPLIIAAPGARANGRSASAIVEALDLYPTLADLCGLTAPNYLDGASLRPLLDDATAPSRDAAFSQELRPAAAGGTSGYTVRSGRWRYIEWNAGDAGRQLFDEDSDPAELHNLAADPAHAATVARLAALIAKIRAQK